MQVSEEVVLKLRERIVAFAASRIGRDEAEDLAQETIMLMQEKYGTVTTLEEMLPLAFRILRFKMTATFRKRVRRGENTAVSVDGVPLAGRSNPEQEAIERQQRALLLRAVAELGERCREILRMKLEGLGFEQIRVRLGAASLNTVYVWDLRCRRQLAERLREFMETPE